MFFLNKKQSVFLLIFIVFLTSCADRERNNPLDPNNPETTGKPVGLNVYSIEKSIVLSWKPIHVNNFMGMKILRRSNIDTVFKEIALASNTSNRYTDEDVEYGVQYRYRIQAVTRDYQSPVSDFVEITPGPSFVWAALGSEGSIIELTHDASHILVKRSNFLFPLGLAVAGYKKGIWIGDFFLDQIVRVSENGDALFYLDGFNGAEDIEYDAVRHTIWVAEPDEAKIVVSDTSGNKVELKSNFKSPSAVSINRNSGECWVADPEANIVSRIQPGGLNVQDFSFTNPQDIVVNSNLGNCWIADGAQVVQIDSAGTILVSSTGFNFANRVAVNESTNECWVVDLLPEIHSARIVKLSSSGTVTLDLQGFADPNALDVDEFDGSCLVADSWNYRIVKISQDGRIIGEWQTSFRPQNVRIAAP